LESFHQVRVNKPAAASRAEQASQGPRTGSKAMSAIKKIFFANIQKNSKKRERSERFFEFGSII